MMIGVATCPVKKQEEDDDDEGYRIFENQELNSFGVGVDDGYLWINGKRTEQIPSFVKFIEGNLILNNDKQEIIKNDKSEIMTAF